VNSPLVSVILVNYNAKKWLKGCLDSLRAQTYRNFEVVLVDNASADGGAGFVEKNYRKVRIIRNRTNEGFARANNLAARRCRGELLLFLNTDTVSPRRMIETLVRFKQKTGNNLVGPRAVDFHGRDSVLGKYMGMNFLGSVHGPSKDLFFLDACALMVSRKDFWELGGFDEKYFLYNEDLDLCWRARLFGMRMAVCEDVRLLHAGGGTSEPTIFKKRKKQVIPIFRRYEVEKNTLRNLLKNYSTLNLLWIIPAYLLQELAESAVYLVTGNFRMASKIGEAVWWNTVNIRDTVRERQRIQAKRVVSDWEILPRTTYKIYKINALLRNGIPSFKG
jgi:GT2 family glycosyltransferase